MTARIVQDLGIDEAEELPKEKDGTKVLAHIFEATHDSLFPLQRALGYDVTQTLFVGPNTLVVEGPADLLYIQAMSSQLQRDGRSGLSDKWTIVPIGGLSKVPSFVALLASQRDLNVVVLVDVQKKDRPLIDDLYKKKFLKRNKVLTFGDFLNQEEADIEDLFDKDFYIALVNREFEGQLTGPIRVAELGCEPRILQALRKHLVKKPLASGRFGHYRPARYFMENTSALWKDVSEETKDRFENIFNKLKVLVS